MTTPEDNHKKWTETDAAATSDRALQVATIAGPLAAALLTMIEADPSQDALDILVARANMLASKVLNDARHEYPLTTD